jgi:hypothetical protein
MSESPEHGPESDESSSKDFEEFIKYNYGESKELGKLFITVLSGILLFSINFSDKVGGVQNAPPYYRFLLLGSWSCLLISIMGCGLALAISWTAARRVLEQVQGNQGEGATSEQESGRYFGRFGLCFRCGVRSYDRGRVHSLQPVDPNSSGGIVTAIRPKTGRVGRCCRLLFAPPLPAQAHPACGLAVSAVHAELPRCRGTPGRARPQPFLRDIKR